MHVKRGSLVKTKALKAAKVHESFIVWLWEGCGVVASVLACSLSLHSTPEDGQLCSSSLLPSLLASHSPDEKGQAYFFLRPMHARALGLGFVRLLRNLLPSLTIPGSPGSPKTAANIKPTNKLLHA